MTRRYHAHPVPSRPWFLDALRVLGSGAAFLFILAVVLTAIYLVTP